MKFARDHGPGSLQLKLNRSFFQHSTAVHGKRHNFFKCAVSQNGVWALDKNRTSDDLIIGKIP